MKPLKVCLDSRLQSGAGGIEQVMIALAVGLSKLDDGDEEYLFLANPGDDEWIRPYLRGPCQLMHPDTPPRSAPTRALRASLQFAYEHGVRRPEWLKRPADDQDLLVASDGTIERAGVDVVHFPTTLGFLTEVPSIYQPHDLQHLHLPELFEPSAREHRDIQYRAYCDQAALIVMMSSWGRRDVMQHYGLPPEKVAVVNGASILGAYPSPTAADRAAAVKRLGLPERFLFYPAQSWRHKNHLRLLEALASIKERDGTTIPLVCSGTKNDFFPTIQARIKKLGLERDTIFTGFVSTLELRCLYELAQALVFPSRFEGWGMPICEAFAAGVPVACSTATGLPDVTGDAALMFDPEEPKQIADCVLRLWTDPALRADLIERGNRRAALFSLDHAAKIFRAHYRRIGGRRLSADDKELLETPPQA